MNINQPQTMPPLSYNNYLKIKELKTLQSCQSSPPHHDEPLFIIIHQTYELWFKLVLHEIEAVFGQLKERNIRRATFYMKRVNEIMKLLITQIHILETMRPVDFLGFRNILNPASGFQSSQFREVEFAAGMKDELLLNHFKSDTSAFEELKKRMEAPSLKDVFYQILLERNIDPSRDLLKIYTSPDNLEFFELHDLAEELLTLDESIGLWRTHHFTVVERIIGHKRGTGGSTGVEYLKSTTTKRCFPELWEVRTQLN